MKEYATVASIYCGGSHTVRIGSQQNVRLRNHSCQPRRLYEILSIYISELHQRSLATLTQDNSAKLLQDQKVHVRLPQKGPAAPLGEVMWRYLWAHGRYPRPRRTVRRRRCHPARNAARSGELARISHKIARRWRRGLFQQGFCGRSQYRTHCRGRKGPDGTKIKPGHAQIVRNTG